MLINILLTLFFCLIGAVALFFNVGMIGWAIDVNLKGLKMVGVFMISVFIFYLTLNVLPVTMSLIWG